MLHRRGAVLVLFSLNISVYIWWLYILLLTTFDWILFCWLYSIHFLGFSFSCCCSIFFKRRHIQSSYKSNSALNWATQQDWRQKVGLKSSIIKFVWYIKELFFKGLDISAFRVYKTWIIKPFVGEESMTPSLGKIWLHMSQKHPTHLTRENKSDEKHVFSERHFQTWEFMTGNLWWKIFRIITPSPLKYAKARKLRTQDQH